MCSCNSAVSGDDRAVQARVQSELAHLRTECLVAQLLHGDGQFRVRILWFRDFKRWCGLQAQSVPEVIHLLFRLGCC